MRKSSCRKSAPVQKLSILGVGAALGGRLVGRRTQRVPRLPRRYLGRVGQPDAGFVYQLGEAFAGGAGGIGDYAAGQGLGILLVPHGGGVPLRRIVGQDEGEEIVGGVLFLSCQPIVASQQGQAEILVG